MAAALRSLLEQKLVQRQTSKMKTTFPQQDKASDEELPGVVDFLFISFFIPLTTPSATADMMKAQPVMTD